MDFELLAIVSAALLIGWGCTGAMRRYALAGGILDVPNTRSSHTVPTPRGGGLGIVIAASVGFLALAVRGRIPPELSAVLIVGGACIALVGFLDDLRGVPARVRLFVHISAAFAALLASGLPSLQWWTDDPSYGWIEFLTMALGIVWSVNLFNFMDGIDGLAGTESAFIGAAGAGLLICMVNTSSDAGAAAAVFAAAAMGYLWWNWPPARIFMGDVGSGYVGYVIAVLALSAQREHTGSLLAWSILAGIFVVDATITLLRRLARGERVFEAHRRHAYQILSRRWNSHARVTIAALLVNCLWLLPLAALAVGRPEHGLIWLSLAVVPIVVSVLRVGAGGAAER